MKSNEDVLVSISCITYNHAPYIRQCLDGFMMQKTDFKFEVLIHDDASTDGTEEIIREYEKKYPEVIKPLYEEENQYVLGRRGSKTFNYPRAKGKYIALCEGDDYWIDPYKLQKQVDFLEQNSEYGLVRTRFDGYYETRGKYKKDFLRNRLIKDTFEDYLIKAWFVGTCTWLFRVEYTKSVDCFPLFNIGDLPLILEVSARSKVKCIDDITSVYRILDNSASHHKEKESAIHFLEKVHNIQVYFWEKYSEKKHVYKQIQIENTEILIKTAILFGDNDLLQSSLNLLESMKYKGNLKLRVIRFFAKSKFMTFLLLKLGSYYNNR